MNNDIVFKKIYNTTLFGDKFALVMHRKPDGDTIGSAVAFSLFLKKYKKEFQFFCVDEIAPNYHLLLKSAGILDFKINKIDNTVDYKPNFIVLFDCADWKQAGFAENTINRVFTINIDHHISNNISGDINLVIPNISSTCEIIYRFFQKNKISITREVATSLFMGIVTDTGNFSNPATTNSSLFAASRLLLCGAKLKDTHDGFFRNQNIGLLKLWGIALKRLKYSEDSKIVSTFIKLDDFKECGVSENSAEGISNFLQDSLNVSAIIVYGELPDGFIKASIRSDGNLNAAEYAKKFGGGGHKKAAGFATEGMIKEGKDMWEVIELNFLRKV